MRKPAPLVSVLPRFASWTCTFVCVCVAVPALAQTLAPVTVTATRTELPPFEVPASVDVIDGERMRSDGRAQLNLSESVGLVPGLLARDRQNQAQDLQLSIRGFGARSTFGVRGVRLYVDGIPATMPDGQGQLSHIDLASAGRVEILRGPFSALYGNSSGGVMQVFTEKGSGPSAAAMDIGVGGDVFFRRGFKASGGFDPAETSGYSLSASRTGTGGSGSREHSASLRNLGNARLDWSLANGGQLMLVANHVDLRADDPLGLSRAQFESAPPSADPAAIQFNTRKTVRQDQLGLVYEQVLERGYRLRAMLYQGERATVQYQAIPVAAQTNPLHPGGVIDLSRVYGGVDLRLTSQGLLAGLPLEVVAGLAYDNLREHRLGFLNFSGGTLGVAGALRRDEINRVSNLDPYVQATLKLTPKWTVHTGLRRSTVRFDSSDNYVSGLNGNDSGSVRYAANLPVLGVMYALQPDVRLYATAGRGFETPTLNELAYRPSGSPGLNLELRPSRSDNLELGAKWRASGEAGKRFEGSLAIFQTGTRDEIVTQTNLGGRGTFQNAGTTRRRGVEFASSVSGPAGWLAGLSYTWLDARYRDAFTTCQVSPCAIPNVAVPAGNRIPGIARSSLAVEAGWRPPLGWRAGIEGRYLGRVPVNDVNTDEAASFLTSAAHVGYVAQVDGWKLAATLRVDNIFDKRYAGSVIVNEGNGRYFETAAGRSWLWSVNAQYLF